MIQVTKLRSGTTFQEDGEPYRVLKYSHTKMGRGSATVRVGVRNLRTGRVKERSYDSTAQVEPLVVTNRKLQYLYKDARFIHFMDPDSFEQIDLNSEIFASELAFLKEGDSVNVMFCDLGDSGTPIPLGADLPPKMVMKVVSTSPGVKGNTASNMYKPATLENGFQTKVPLFVKEGDKIRLDTRTGEYIERAN